VFPNIPVRQHDTLAVPQDVSAPIERGNARVTVVTNQGPVRLPWESRQQLLARVRPRDDGAAVVRAFEAVGTSRPVRLDDTGEDLLWDVVEQWLEEVGEPGLPAGVMELRNVLITGEWALGNDAP
jgi:hypothetical protein